MGCVPSKDMAVCFVFFNPAKSKRLLMNYLYVNNVYKSAGLPVFTIELVFEGSEPEIPHAHHVRGSSYMFHKERLCRLLEKRIPQKYTKLVFLDADVLFEDPLWYWKTSEALEEHDVVQPFSKAHWLDLTYTNVELSRETAVKMIGPYWDFKYHPGFAWAFRREWYQEIGFFDWAISGSGDTLSCAKWMNKKFHMNFKSLPNAMKREYAGYLKKHGPRISCIEGNAFHLYHGSRKNRQYAERHKLLDIPEHIEDMITLNKYGVYEWKDMKWNQVFLDYFKTREDDDLSEDVSGIKVVLTS